jgi:hypothetical protein
MTLFWGMQLAASRKIDLSKCFNNVVEQFLIQFFAWFLKSH